MTLSCATLQHTATRCDTLQHAATHYNTLQHTFLCRVADCNRQQHTAAHCNTLQHTATHCNTLQHTATHMNVSCSTVPLRRIYKHCEACHTYERVMSHTAAGMGVKTIDEVASTKWYKKASDVGIQSYMRHDSCIFVT